MKQTNINFILNQFQLSVRHNLKQAKRLLLQPFASINPSLPLLPSLRSKYYNQHPKRNSDIEHLKAIARHHSHTAKATGPQA